MQTKAVYLSGLTTSEQILLESYMDLLVLRDGSRFDITEVMEEAQIEVFDPQVQATNTTASQRRSRIAFVAPGSETSEHSWALQRPVRLSNLREVLSAVTSEQAIDSKVDNPVLEHRKLEYWLGLLERFESQGDAWELKGFKDLRVRIYFKHKRVYLSDEKKWSQQVIHTSRALATAIPDEGLPTADYSQSIDQFRWQLCQLLSGGLLLPGIADRSTFNISNWPDFGVLGANQNHMKLSALFHGRDLTIPKAAEISALAVSTVIDFINACAALGLLKDAPEQLLGHEAFLTTPEHKQVAPVVRVVSKPHLFGQFLGKLRGAFGLRG